MSITHYFFIKKKRYPECVVKWISRGQDQGSFSSALVRNIIRRIRVCPKNVELLVFLVKAMLLQTFLTGSNFLWSLNLLAELFNLY